MTEYFNVPLCGIKQSEQQFDGGGFARAVRSEQAEDFSRPHLEIHIVHRFGFGPAPEVLEYFRQPANDNDVILGWRVARCGLWTFLFQGNHTLAFTPAWVPIAASVPPVGPALCPLAARTRPGTVPVL